MLGTQPKGLLTLQTTLNVDLLLITPPPPPVSIDFCFRPTPYWGGSGCPEPPPSPDLPKRARRKKSVPEPGLLIIERGFIIEFQDFGCWVDVVGVPKP